jgi:hypothetical protein
MQGEKKMAMKVDDEDTGGEIIYFMRRGKPYLYLRGSPELYIRLLEKRVKKRLTEKEKEELRGRLRGRLLIKRLQHVEKRFYMVVDYDKEEAKKGNPLYVDAGIFTLFNAENFTQREEAEKKLKEALEGAVERLFGKAVVKKLLQEAGVSYGSEPYYRTEYANHKATSLVVWKHHLEDKPKMKETEEKL